MVAGGRDVTGMKRPTIRIGYLMELVAAAAVCTALARDVRPPLIVTNNWVQPLIPLWWGWGAVAGGLASAGGVGLAIEAIRGRRPSSWGIGRWIWSISGVTMALWLLDQSFDTTLSAIKHRRWPTLLEYSQLLRHEIDTWWLGAAPWVLAGVVVTAMLARSPRDPEPDTREWLGRLFAGLVVTLKFAWSAIWILIY